VQTFLPYPDLRASSQVLDDRRLGKQRVETFQILRALTWPAYAWKNHPAVRMWRGFLPALVDYGLENCREWTRRGYADTVAPQLLQWSGGVPPTGYQLPPWFGHEPLHLSHRSALLRKDPAFYRPLFDRLGHEGEPDDLPYLWPPDVFPRWPVRPGGAPLQLDDAVRLLGFPSPRPGQAEAALAAQEGRDVLLVARPGSGGSATGLLAGLLVPGRTLWVSPREREPAPPAPEVPLVAWREVVAADRQPPLARPPQPEDLAAMRAEIAPPEFRFLRADGLDDVDLAGYGLVVVDRAGALSYDDAQPLRTAASRPPLLLVTGRADAGERAALAERFGLRDAVHAGGGWDPTGSRLAAEQAPTAVARRRALERLVREQGPAVVLTASRERADRVVTALAAAGLRAAAWAPPPMRPTRAAAAVGAWRSRRLDALVVPDGELPPLGRGRVRLLVADGVSGVERWREVVEHVCPEAAVVVAPADASPEVAGYAAADGCRRERLLAPFGEPVAVPCGHCDWCATTAGSAAQVLDEPAAE
jgi:hypothetical protein